MVGTLIVYEGVGLPVNRWVLHLIVKRESEKRKMPWKPKTPCHHPGCNELCDGYYCAKHRTEHEAQESLKWKEYYKEYNRQGRREAGHDARYGRRWREVRNAYITAHPICEMCEEQGRIRPATIVHHKIETKNGGTDDWDNLMSLCASCHNFIHTKMKD